MYGKHFASMYGGSMFGKPAVVFAVWGYVIALMRPSRKDSQCYVELNPSLLAATFATTVDEILEAIGTLEAPDPGSRSKVEDGRRLVCLSDKSHGPMQFRVVNGQHYRSMRDEEERREYLRVAKQRSRAKQSTKSTTDNRGQPPSSQAEEDVDVDSDSKESKSLPASPSEPQRASVRRMKSEAAKTIVESFQLDDSHRIWAAQNTPSVPPDEELESWKDRMRANGYRTNQGPVKDAAATWRGNMKNAEKWGVYAKRNGAERRGSGAGREDGTGEAARAAEIARKFPMRTIADLQSE